MIFFEDLLSLGSIFLTIVISIAIIPVLFDKKIRYYGCYICYVVVISSSAFVLFPVFLLRPRNIDNLRLASFLLKYVTNLIGIKWILYNKEILEENRGAVIVANHQSILDILGMLNIWHVLKKCTGVAKKELLYIPPFGPMAWLGGLIFINRVDPKKANQELQEACGNIKKDKVKIWIFPEGTRNKSINELLPFKKGAFRVAVEQQVPIIPVVFSSYYFIDSVNKVFNTGQVIISPLEPISTVGLTHQDIDSLKEKVYKIMSNEFKKLQDAVSINAQKFT